MIDSFPSLASIDADQYAKKAREVILDILARGKVPIIEGGSFFYVKHIFEGTSVTSPDESKVLNESKILAKQVIEQDNHDFSRTLARLE